MRILHTGDWHLGKYLDQYSRLEEQKAFIDELCLLVETKHVDLIIIAGDVYDTYNPPAQAEQLFYTAMQRLSQGGQRPIIIIAGNHDNPERITAPWPMLIQQGVITVGTPKTIVPTAAYEHFEITATGAGFIELKIADEELVILTMPYPSEKRLNELIGAAQTEREIQKSYSARIADIFTQLATRYRPGTIHIAVGHFYILGGEISKSERDIQLGGSYAVSADALPPAQYIAMGHLHRAQAIKCKCPHAYYAGSPIQYSKSESKHPKCCYIADIKAGDEAQVEKIYLRNYKPIEVWRTQGVQEALQKCRDHAEEDTWVFLEIVTDSVLLQSEIKEMHATKKDIIEIYPMLPQEAKEKEAQSWVERSVAEEFTDFYYATRHVVPSKETLELFLKLCLEAEA